MEKKGKVYNFQEQVAVADEFEKKILTYYRSLPRTINITDLRDNQKFRDLDIDFLYLWMENSFVKSSTIEVKLDFRTCITDNFFVEVGPKGWYEKCKAETILYVDVGRNVGYYLDNKKLHDFIDAHKDEYESRKVSTSDFGGYDVTGLLVPYTKVVNALNPYTEDLTQVFDENN